MENAFGKRVLKRCAWLWPFWGELLCFVLCFVLCTGLDCCFVLRFVFVLVCFRFDFEIIVGNFVKYVVFCFAFCFRFVLERLAAGAFCFRPF